MIKQRSLIDNGKGKKDTVVTNTVNYLINKNPVFDWNVSNDYNSFKQKIKLDSKKIEYPQGIYYASQEVITEDEWKKKLENVWITPEEGEDGTGTILAGTYENKSFTEVETLGGNNYYLAVTATKSGTRKIS
jgi:hypothetical protein